MSQLYIEDESGRLTRDNFSTDPSSFDIYLVNNAVYPPVNQLIAKNVETSKGSYTLDGLKNVPAE